MRPLTASGIAGCSSGYQSTVRVRSYCTTSVILRVLSGTEYSIGAGNAQAGTSSRVTGARSCPMAAEAAAAMMTDRIQRNMALLLSPTRTAAQAGVAE